MTPQQQQEAQKKAARAFAARWQKAEGGDEERIVEHLFTFYAQAAADRPERRRTAESTTSV